MGCLGIGLAALLALAVPASIAPSSLVGAYVVIALLAAFATAAAGANGRRRRLAERAPAARLPVALTQIGVLSVAYAVVVTIIHAAAT